MRKRLISMCFLLSLGQYLCWWTIASTWYSKWVLCIWSTQQDHTQSLIWMRTKTRTVQ
jgi:hypothetical protein